MRFDEKLSCSTRFDSRRQNAQWKDHPTLVPGNPSRTYLGRILDHIGQCIAPIVRDFRSRELLYEAPVGDGVTAKWSLTANGAMRAAQCVSVRRRIGLSADDIVSALEPRKRWIAAVLDAEQPASFLKGVLSDWDSRN